MMSKPLDSLFSAYTLNKLTLENRIVMAPMTREFSPQGIPDDDVAAYYKRRAAGGTGLIVTEGTTVNDAVASMGENIPTLKHLFTAVIVTVMAGLGLSDQNQNST